MKIKLFALAFIVIPFFLSCKSSKSISKQKKQTSGNDTNLRIGRVSYKYKPSGCGAVVLFFDLKTEDTVILIPQNLPNEFDKDGLVIKFEAQPLRIHQPKGCGEGMPVHLNTIKLVK